MAIYHLHHGFVTRTTGRSAVQAVAYICGAKLHEDLRGQDVDYRKKAKEVAIANTIAPENSKYKDINVWNEIEKFENRYADNHFKREETRNNYKECAQTASTIVVALPNELGLESNHKLIEKFIEARFLSRNLITTYAIHNKEGNVHAHLQISRRAIGEDGEFVGRKDREICTKSSLLETRRLWAELANEELAKAGFKDRITEKSFADLGIDLEGTKHVGWYGSSIGTDSRIAGENLEIEKRNEERILNNPSIILDMINEKKAVFTQKDILKEIEKRVLDQSKVAEIFERCLDVASYVGESIRGEFLYTGEKYQKLESEVMRSFEEASIHKNAICCESDVRENVLNRYDYLSEEQKVAVVNATREEGFSIIIGKAGAGKTTTMKAISEIYRESGARVIGMSLSALASDNLGKDAGIESGTIASWSHRWRSYDLACEKFLSFNEIVAEGIFKQLDWYKELKLYEGSQLQKGDVIVVDEAGMVGTKEWHNILDFAKKFEAKVIAVGDDNQFNPIGAGDCFRNFIDMAKRSSQNTISEIAEIRRQKVEWMRDASRELSKLNTSAGLAIYENRGKLKEYESVKTITDKYLEMEEVVVLCATKNESIEINDAIREAKKERGEIGKDLVHINNRFFAESDKIMFLKNDIGLGIKNGDIGIIKFYNESDKILSIETESGIKNIDTSKYSDIDHGYAITLHKSQGKTYENAILVANKMMDSKAFYVGMTRHRNDLEIYYKKEEFRSFKDLAMAGSRYRHKDLVSDFREVRNEYKERVIDYQETNLETKLLAREAINQESSWDEYHKLKEKNKEIGREILSDIKNHGIYLKQMGITKDKLEISVGEKSSPLSIIEMDSKDRITKYVDTSLELKQIYNEMKKTSYNITKHKDYERYVEIRNTRNTLGEDILKSKDQHKEFMQSARQKLQNGYLSFKTMENQINYAKSITNNHQKTKSYIIDLINRAQKYSQYEDNRNSLLDKLRAIKNEGHLDLKGFIKEAQEGGLYKRIVDHHLEKEGYGLYVNNKMLDHYIMEKKLDLKLNGTMNEYASMLVQRELGKLQEATPEMIESAMKVAVCFESLKASSGNKLTPGVIEDIHQKAHFLAENIKDENLNVLNNKSIMKEVADNISLNQTSNPNKTVEPLSEQNNKQILSITQNEQHKNKTIHHSINRDFQLSV